MGMAAAEAPANKKKAFLVLASLSLTVSTTTTSPKRTKAIASTTSTGKGNQLSRAPKPNKPTNSAKIATNTKKAKFLICDDVPYITVSQQGLDQHRLMPRCPRNIQMDWLASPDGPLHQVIHHRKRLPDGVLRLQATDGHVRHRLSGGQTGCPSGHGHQHRL